MSRRRRTAATALLAVVCALTPAAAGANIQDRIGSSRAKDRALQGAIGADSRRIAGVQSHLDDLRQELAGLTASLRFEQTQLSSLQTRLRTARARLQRLRLAAARDRAVLAAQLVGQYETPHPDLVTVVLNARGFGELLELADNLARIGRHNADVVDQVRRSRTAVAAQTKTLARLEAQQQRVTTAALVQHDEVAQIEQELAGRQAAWQRSRALKRAHLARLRAHRRTLEDQLAKAQAAALGIDAGPGLPSGGAPGFAAHGGAFGFFQAPGTNYSVGDEPQIAARLDVMGKALHLHLIGLSGYRTPQHSVEVGGFANDPHTRGQASDTPGLEGVPESVLNHYGLTRPFPGAAEADHVQLVGSI